MDEPFSGLDARLRDSVRTETLTVLRETGATAIVVTHDPEEAMRMSDRIVLMRAGRITQQGTPEDLYNRPQSLFAARFFSPLNEIAAVIRSGIAETACGQFAGNGLADGEAIVAIRPQGVIVSGRDDRGGGLAGRIISRHFLGEVDHFDVAVEGLDTYLRARGRADPDLLSGSEVRVRFDPRDILVFAGETDGSKS
jgi:iron(III) transport system ATP-binding protein